MTPTRIAYCFLVDKLKGSRLCKGLDPPEMSKIVNNVSSMQTHAAGQNMSQLHTHSLAQKKGQPSYALQSPT